MQNGGLQGILSHFEDKIKHRVLNFTFLDDQEFQNYWFSTGSPDFLVKQMRNLTFYNVENSVVNNRILDKYDIDNMELIPLLFQTGYLTVKKKDKMTGNMVLDYPNREVRESMYTFLIDDVATAKEGLDQIKNQDYAAPYRASDKLITGIGVNFNADKDKKGIDDWVVEVL